MWGVRWFGEKEWRRRWKEVERRKLEMEMEEKGGSEVEVVMEAIGDEGGDLTVAEGVSQSNELATAPNKELDSQSLSIPGSYDW